MHLQATKSYQPAYLTPNIADAKAADDVSSSPETEDTDAAIYIASDTDATESAHDDLLPRRWSKPQTRTGEASTVNRRILCCGLHVATGSQKPALSHLDETEPAEKVAHPDKDDIFLLNNPNQSNTPNLPGHPGHFGASHSANP